MDTSVTPPVEPSRPLPVLLGVLPEPQEQNRVLVGLRLLLAIPHVIVLCALTIGAAVLTFLGWFGALITGRLPRFARDYLCGFVHWSTRVRGYLLLLTDAYPPFSLGDADYPVHVAIPSAGPLNRLAVLFRWLLVIPAAIVGALLGLGAGTIVVFAAWLCTLILGRLPAPLHDAFAAIVRFEARLAGYWCMLTPAYPGRLFGDSGLFGDKEPHEAWPLRLSKGAKGVLAGVLALGIVTYGVYAGIQASTGTNTASVSDVDRDYTTLVGALAGYRTGISHCRTGACATGQAAGAAKALRTFAGNISSLSMPTTATQHTAGRLAASANLSARIFDKAATATSTRQFNDIAGSSALESALTQVDSSYEQLRTGLQQAG